MSDNTNTFAIKQYIDPAQLKRDLTYSPANLQDAMMQQASLFAHYGVEAAKASRQVDVVKMLLETAEAAVYRKMRDNADMNGEKITETQLEKMISREDRIIKLKKALNEAKQIEANGKIAVEAFRHRRDMLVQQGLINREEMKGEISIAVKTAKENELEQTRQAILARRQSQLEN